ncbi:MAG: DUF3445 domain-containing protein [Devosia sp.]|nr:DUF3445 domain-containing protein [Devosia sp.]
MSSPSAPSPLSRAFHIGVRPLGVDDWIDIDARLPAYLDEKARLEQERPDDVFAAEPGTAAGQAEVLQLLGDYLPMRFPQVYRRIGERIDIVPAGRSVELGAADPPLRIAARLVAEDLILMRRDARGWRLAAGALSFPSAWTLADKFSRPMEEVHGPVPGFGAGSRHAQLISRMFDAARPSTPMLRWNWSLFGDDRLFHPEGSHASHRFGDDGSRVYLRLERQTLRKLAGTGDMLFTIRIHVDPISVLTGRPEGRAVAAELAAQLAAMSGAQLNYKGLLTDRDRLIGRLTQLADGVGQVA